VQYLSPWAEAGGPDPGQTKPFTGGFGSSETLHIGRRVNLISFEPDKASGGARNAIGTVESPGGGKEERRKENKKRTSNLNSWEAESLERQRKAIS